MKPARNPLVMPLMILLSAGLLCSQICDFNCSVYGCSSSTFTKASAEPHQDGHCHQHESKPVTQGNGGQEHGQSPACPGHFDLMARAPSAPILANSLQTSPQLHLPTAQFFSLASASLDYQAKQAERKPDRSPPAHPVLRI
jgi:hypothetical protein